MPTAKKKTLHEALLDAQQDIGSIDKDKRNTFANYDYVSAERMIATTRAVFAKHGITFTAGNVELVPFAVGEHGDAVLVNQGFTVTKADETLTMTRGWPAVPAKGRPLDKAVAGALTANLSYTLRDLLLIPRGDEDGVGMDDTSRKDQIPAPRKKAEPRARAKPKAVSQADVVNLVGGDPSCPACGSRVWDNRNDPKRKPKAPLWKCSNNDCKGGRNDWPWASWDEWPMDFGEPPEPTNEPTAPAPEPGDYGLDERGEDFNGDIEIPF
tara:strand:- start:14423 stop:15226 length:804 start_codon:yes stop_codon:yes gene_type:complete